MLSSSISCNLSLSLRPHCITLFLFVCFCFWSFVFLAVCVTFHSLLFACSVYYVFLSIHPATVLVYGDAALIYLHRRVIVCTRGSRFGPGGDVYAPRSRTGTIRCLVSDLFKTSKIPWTDEIRKRVMDGGISGDVINSSLLFQPWSAVVGVSLASHFQP